MDLNQNDEWDSELGEPWTISDANGDYSFEGLQPPSYPFTYTVAETVPAGYTVTAPASETHSVTFNQEGTVTDKDFGNTPGVGTQKVDVFFVCDATGSLENPETGVFPEVIDIVDDLTTAYPNIDWAFGLGRFAEYASYQTSNATDRPFILNQPIIADDHPYFEVAITAAGQRNAGGYGGDSPETATEALYQIATGAGFDGNDDGDTTDSLVEDCYQMQTAPGSSGDVIAFSEFPEDPAHYIYAADGTLGGVGFRGGSIAIVIVTTDDGTRYEPEDPAVQTVHGVNDVLYSRFQTCSAGDTPDGRGAKIVETVDALTALGIRVIGLGDETYTPDRDPRPMLEAYAEVTGAVNNGTTTIQNGTADPIAPGDPLYFNIDDAALGAHLSSGILDQMVPEPASMTGIVYNDLNDDGVRDAGEPGEQYRTVFVDFDQDGVLDAGEYHTQTDANGEYTFGNLPLGEYRVRVVLPAGYGHTPPGYEEAGITYVNSGAIIKAADIGIQEVTAYDDYFTVSEDPDTPLTISVSTLTALDETEVPSTQNPVSFSAIDTSESVGNIVLDGSTIIYTPPEDWHGTDTFLYSLTDGYDYTDWAIVTVEVVSVNDAPRIPDTQFRMHENDSISGDLWFDVEGNGIIGSYDGIEHGSLTLNNDGTFVYEPDTDFVGVERFTVNATDSLGDSEGDVEIAIYVCEMTTDFGDLETAQGNGLTAVGLIGGSNGANCASEGAIAASGDRMLVGSPSGTALLYRESEFVSDAAGSRWVLDATLQSAEDGDGFGCAVAMSGDIAVVGAKYADIGSDFDAGAAYVFEFDGVSWNLVATLTASMGGPEPDLDDNGSPDHSWAQDLFGAAVAINEEANTIVIGAPKYEYCWVIDQGGFLIPQQHAEAGAAYVFELDGGSWTFKEKLEPQAAERQVCAHFGNSVDVSGDAIIVGAYQEDDGANQDNGAAYVFETAGVWSRTKKLSASDGEGFDLFGSSVSIFTDGTGLSRVVTAAIGAPGYDAISASDCGAVYYVTLDGNPAQSEPATYVLSGAGGYEQLGFAVDLEGDVVLAGAPTAMFSPYYGVNWMAGEAYWIDINDAQWQTNGLVANPSPSGTNLFGASVAIGERGAAILEPGADVTADEGAVHSLGYNRTPTAEDTSMGWSTVSPPTDRSVFGIDAYEGTLSFSIVSQASHGTVSINGTTGAITGYVPTSDYPDCDSFTYKVTDAAGAEAEGEVTLYFGESQILNRGIFYNGYFGDARDISRKADNNMVVGEDPSDENDNIVTHPHGITGVIIDIAFPSDPEAFSPADFTCTYVNSGGAWETIIPTEITVEVITGLEAEEGTGNDPDYDCHRVRLTFAADTIKNWLEVTMDDSNLGVSSDTFYFGYLDGDASGDGSVGSADLDQVRAYWGSGYTVPVAGDLNGDGNANSSDLDIIRANWGATVPSPPSRSMAMSSSLSSSSSSTSTWTAEADQVFADYGIGDDDPTNDLAIDQKFWKDLYKALGLKW